MFYHWISVFLYKLAFIGFCGVGRYFGLFGCFGSIVTLFRDWGYPLKINLRCLVALRWLLNVNFLILFNLNKMGWVQYLHGVDFFDWWTPWYLFILNIIQKQIHPLIGPHFLFLLTRLPKISAIFDIHIVYFVYLADLLFLWLFNLNVLFNKRLEIYSDQQIRHNYFVGKSGRP